MINYIKELILGSTEASRSFTSGIVVGIAIAAGVLILLLIIWGICAIIFRKRKCNGITLPGELGDIFISTSAITAAIRTLETEFHALVIQKIRLIECKNDKVNIYVSMSYDEKGGNAKPYVENFQKRVTAKLREAFGIENVNKVNIDNINFNADHKSKKAFESIEKNDDTDSGPVEFQPLQ